MPLKPSGGDGGAVGPHTHLQADITDHSAPAHTHPMSDITDLLNPLQFRGSIAAPAGFPDPGTVQIGWAYRVTADVTDNDVTKTNTGQSFSAGDDIAWNGTGWTELGPETLDALLVSYDNTISGLAATNAKAALDELKTRIDALKTDAINWFLEVGSNKTYVLAQRVPYAGSITDIALQSDDAGAAGTINVEINGTPVTWTGGAPVVAGAAEETDTASGNNTFAANDKITLVVTGSANLNNVGIKIGTLRN